MLAWSKMMCLDVNTTKCKSLTIYKRKKYDVIEVVGVQPTTSLKMLGVWFDDRGSWSTHVTNITKIVSRRLFAIRTLKPFLTKNKLKTVFYSLIRSLMEYCAPVFAGINVTNSKRLDKLQQRFHRILCGSECELNCLPPLTERRNALVIKFLLKTMKNDHLLHSLLPPMSSSGRFLLPFRRSRKRSDSYFLYASELYNLKFVRR